MKKILCMDPHDLTGAWVGETLTEEAIRAYLDLNLPTDNITHGNLSHIAECCHHLYLWSMGGYPVLGSFLSAILENDLMAAVAAADDINRTALWVYAQFIYNVAPGNWKEMPKRLAMLEARRENMKCKTPILVTLGEVTIRPPFHIESDEES